MRLLNLTFTLALLAMALNSVDVVARGRAATEVVPKSDLGISLFDAGTNIESKGDCDCAASPYGNTTTVNGFHKGFGEDIPAVSITPAAASAAEEVTTAPAAGRKRTTLKSVAVKGGDIFLRMKVGRLTACVFGAPNASGCGN
jgi:hypothetical protein